MAENCAEPTDCWVSLQGHDALVLLSRPFHLSAPTASLARARARGVTPWRSLTSPSESDKGILPVLIATTVLVVDYSTFRYYL